MLFSLRILIVPIVLVVPSVVSADHYCGIKQLKSSSDGDVIFFEDMPVFSLVKQCGGDDSCTYQLFFSPSDGSAIAVVQAFEILDICSSISRSEERSLTGDLELLEGDLRTLFPIASKTTYRMNLVPEAEGQKRMLILRKISFFADERDWAVEYTTGVNFSASDALANIVTYNYSELITKKVD